MKKVFLSSVSICLAIVVSLWSGDVANARAVSDTPEKGSVPRLNAPTYFPTGAEGRSLQIVVADFDASGLDDIATANYDSASYSVLLNDGAGGLQAPIVQALPFGGPVIAVENFDDDGIPDIVAATRESDTVVLQLGNGDGTFRNGQSFEVCRGTSIVAEDFDGDGNGDVAVGTHDCGHAGILFGDGAGGFAEPVLLETGNALITAGDANGDTLPDLISRDSGTGFKVWLSDGHGGFEPRIHNENVGNPRAIHFADMNNDVFPDVLEGFDTDFSVAISLGDGTGQFYGAPKVQVAMNPATVRAIDFNGDGALDMAGLSYTWEGRFQVLLGDGAGGVAAATAAIESRGGAFEVGNFDGDSLTDFAFTENGNPSAGILLGRNFTARFDVCVDANGQQFRAVTHVAPTDPAYGYYEHYTETNGFATGIANVVKRTARQIRLKDADDPLFTLDAKFNLVNGNVKVKSRLPSDNIKWTLTASGYADGGCLQ